MRETRNLKLASFVQRVGLIPAHSPTDYETCGRAHLTCLGFPDFSKGFFIFYEGARLDWGVLIADFVIDRDDWGLKSTART